MRVRRSLWGLVGVILAWCTVAAPTASYGALTAPSAPTAPGIVGDACVYPDSTANAPHVQAYIHCYTAAQIRQAYGVDDLSEMGDGQTIVLVDSYGEPAGAQDLQVFHDTFFPNEPDPNFTAIYPNGSPNFSHGTGNGKSGPAAAAGWAGEAALDIEWAYAIAPHAHIVLIGVPPAE